MRPLVFVDCETTHLDTKHGEVYEVALTRVDDDVALMGDVLEPETKDFWIEPTQLQSASSSSLQVGRFYERSRNRPSGMFKLGELGYVIIGEQSRYETAMEIAHFTEGCHLVGAKPDFDAGFLAAFLRDNGACPAWHHRLIDVESLAIGVIVGEAETWGRPQSLSDICAVLNIPRDRHTARGDVEATLQVYVKLMKLAAESDRARQTPADRGQLPNV